MTKKRFAIVCLLSVFIVILFNSSRPIKEPKCRLCSTKLYENTSQVIERNDALGVLFINDGIIQDIRFYEMDDTGEKIYISGTLECCSYYSDQGYSGGNICVDTSHLLASITISLANNHNVQNWKLPQLYCKECTQKIKNLNAGTDVAIMDFDGYELHEISYGEDFFIRNYEVITESFSNEEISLTVQYYPLLEA